MFIKVRFIREGSPVGREYTYSSKIPVEVGEQVELPTGGIGVVTEVNIPEEEIASYRDKIREIIGKKEGCS